MAEEYSPYAVPSIKQRLTGYIESPKQIIFDLQNFIKVFFYNISNLFDPYPYRKPKESDIEYFDRIDPRFGVRFYKHRLNTFVNYDITLSGNYIDENYSRARDRKALKRLVLVLNEIQQENIENFKRYLIRFRDSQPEN